MYIPTNNYILVGLMPLNVIHINAGLTLSSLEKVGASFTVRKKIKRERVWGWMLAQSKERDKLMKGCYSVEYFMDRFAWMPCPHPNDAEEEDWEVR